MIENDVMSVVQTGSNGHEVSRSGLGAVAHAQPDVLNDDVVRVEVNRPVPNVDPRRRCGLTGDGEVGTLDKIGLLSAIVPLVSKMTKRGPVASRASRSDPDPLSLRLVTLRIAPPRPPRVSTP